MLKTDSPIALSRAQNSEAGAGLERLLAPRSVAIIGGREAAIAVAQCMAIGFEGEIWPVHPTKDTVHGHRVYHSIDDLPGAPDAAFIAVNRNRIVPVIDALSKRGAGGAICYASGFSEADALGEELQRALVEAAGVMPVIGPNCYGLLNFADGVVLWPDQHGGKRLEKGKTGVAIITQSSNIAVNISMQRRGLPVSHILTVGNQAQTGLSQLANRLLNDPRVSALGLHIEGFDDVGAIEQLARAARVLEKPIVAMKMGRSVEAQQAAFTHTASLAGSDEAANAFFERLAIARVNSIPSFLETLKLLHVHGALEGYDISSMSCSGGEASLMADSSHGRKVHLRDLTADQKNPISDALGPLVAIANPLDYHTYVWGDREGMEAVYTGMLAAKFDLNCLVLDYPRDDRCGIEDWEVPTRALIKASRETGARAAVLSTMHENLDEKRAAALIDQGIAPMLGIDECLDAIEAAAAIGEGWRRDEPEPVMVVADLVSGGEFVPDEAQAKQLLCPFGIAIPGGEKISFGENRDGVAATLAAAEKTGYPVVLKALGIAHKSELNGLRLNLGDGPAVERAAMELSAISSALYLEEMITDGVFELLVGVTHDAQFGLVMTLATGGTMVEIFDDSQTLLLPSSRVMVEEALLRLKSRVFFEGFRGGPRADLGATLDTIMAVQKFALANSDKLVELDINPLIIRPAGDTDYGAIAADALIRLRR